jgi:hypothetical protein
MSPFRYLRFIYTCSRTVAVQQPRCECDQRSDRQPDDIEVVALDVADKQRAALLDRVGTRAPAPLVGVEVGLDLALRRSGTAR